MAAAGLISSQFKGNVMYHPRFKGNHYEIGLKYGGLLKKNNIDLFGLTELDDFQFN